MSESEILLRLRECAGGLVGENLRSAAVVLRRMRELIFEAHGMGHSHRAIHASLEAAGLQASWNTYKSCLVRMKKKASGATPTPRPASASGWPSLQSNPVEGWGQKFVPITDHVETSPNPSATRVLDALLEAKQAASRDYAQIARDLRRRNRQ